MPHNWNATDTLLDKGSVGWYRKEFTLPRVPSRDAKRTFWKVRFEGANYRAKVWLNGQADRQLHRLLPVRGRPRRAARGVATR